MSRHSKLHKPSGSKRARAAIAHAGLSTYPYGTLVSFLHSLQGIRGTWTILGHNSFPYSFGGMAFKNATPTMGVWDEDLQLPYTHLTRASNQLMDNTGANWANNMPAAHWDPNPGLSIGMWLRVTSYAAPLTNQTIMACWGLSNFSWNLFINNYTYTPIHFKVSADSSSVAAECIGSKPVPLDKWVFICAKWKPSTHIIAKLYYDGEQQDEAEDLTSIPAALYYDSSMTGSIGGYTNFLGPFETIDADIGATYFGVTHFSDETEDTIHQIGRKAYKV